MGEIIQFPENVGSNRGGRYVDASSEPATVIVLPFLPVERSESNIERLRKVVKRKTPRRKKPEPVPDASEAEASSSQALLSDVFIFKD